MIKENYVHATELLNLGLRFYDGRSFFFGCPQSIIFFFLNSEELNNR